MKYSKINISKYLFLISLFVVNIFCSCEDETTEETEEFKLSGNIESLIPDYSYSIKHNIAMASDGTNYLVAKPEFIGALEDNLEYWGLNVKNVEYYIDNTLFETTNSSPFGLVRPVSDIGLGNHTLTAKITICGKECNDAVLEVSDDFKVYQTSSSRIKTTEIYLDYNYVCKGETFKLTPYILEERSADNSKITKVEYYWDNKLISTKTQSPFTWEYQVTDDAGSSHSVMAVIRYSYGNNYTGDLTWSYNTYTIMAEDDCRYSWTEKLSDNNKVYKNGETVESVAKCHKGKDCTDNVSFKLYYDDKLVGEATTFPYEIDYKLENQSVGYHTFKSEWTKTHTNGTYNSSSSESTIIVLP